MRKNLFAASLFCASVPGIASGQVLFAEPFDDAGADVTINQQADTAVTFVSYDNMTIGSANFSIPEAPRALPGGAATSGVLIQANISDGLAAGVNILAGSSPVAFTGDYTVSFDAWINVPTDPFPDGSTEQILWGVGVDNTDPIEARNTRFDGTAGTWGWLAGENGYGTEDAAIFENGTELADLGDTQTGEGDPFNAAFTDLLGGTNAAPANQWVQVDILVAGGNVSVRYNGVEFFSQASSSTDGFAMLGYEDPFSSVGTDPDGQWALFDNFRVVPAPGTASLVAIGLCGLMRRRR